jgi:hypothetical protein
MYDDGNDITKQLDIQVQEALNMLEAQQIGSSSISVRSVESPFFGTESNFKIWEMGDKGKAPDQHQMALSTQSAVLEEHRDKDLHRTRHQQQTLIADFKRTRTERERAMRQQIAARHRKAIAREQNWCQNEIAQGKHWCRCAPFADDYLFWTDCRPQ